MKKSIITLGILLIALTFYAMSISGKEESTLGSKYTQLASTVDDEGTNGGVTWELRPENILVFKPTNGQEGTLNDLTDANMTWSQHKDDVVKVIFESGVKASGNVSKMFKAFSKLESIDFLDFDTSNTTKMSAMFQNTPKLETINFGSNFDTSNVKNMSAMFRDATALTSLDFGDKFDTSKVTTMYGMFYNASSIEELNLGDKFDTSKVNNIKYMFRGMSKLHTLNLGDKFNTENVLNMEKTFYGDSLLEELNLGDKFNTAKVTTMKSMFDGLTNLKKLVIPDTFVFTAGSDPKLVVPHGDEYSNKWIKEDKSAGPFTVEELYENKDGMTGSLVWKEREKINVNPTVTFENGYSKLPDTINMKLIKDGVDANDVVTISKADINEQSGEVQVNFGEKLKFNDAAEEQAITYTVDLEAPIANFTKISEGHYKYTSEKINITIEKNWQGGSAKIPDTVDVKIKRNDEDLKTVTLSKDAGWSLLVEDLDKTDETGADYTYTIEEVTNIEGFTGSVENFVITNVYKSLADELVAVVKYVGGEALRQPITITLKRTVEGNEETVRDFVVNPNDFNEDGLSELSFEDMPRTNEEGKDYTYSIEATDVEHFKKEVQGINAIFTYEEDYIDVPVNIIWNGGANAKPENITVELENGENLVQTKTVSKDDTTVTFTDVPVRDENNNFEDINYTISSSDVKDFTKLVDDASKTVTYTYVAPTANINATIKKEGGKAVPIEVELYKDGNPTGEKVTINSGEATTFPEKETTDNDGTPVTYTLKVNPAGLPEGYRVEADDNGNDKVVYTSTKMEYTKGVELESGKAIDLFIELVRNGEVVPGSKVAIKAGQEHTWTDLDKTDEDGNAYTYDIQVTEDTVLPTGYSLLADPKGNIRLQFISPKQNIQITKNWVDGEEARPDEITVVVKADGKAVQEVKLTKADNKKEDNLWDAEVEVDQMNDKADPIEYTVEEKKVEGFTPKYDQAGLSITNTYVIPTATVKAQVVYVGGKDRPELKVELKGEDGSVVSEAVANKAGDIYEALFENTKITDKKGKKINYKFDLKKTPENYARNVSKNVIKLTYVSPTIDVTKTVKVPAEYKGTVDVQLFSNGKKTNKFIKLTADELRKNGNKVTFKDVDENDKNGNKNTYTAKAITEILGYEKSEDKEENTVYTYTGSPKDKVIKTTYVGGDKLPRETISVNILRDGVKANSVKVKSAETVINNLPMFNKAGKAYKYTLEVVNGSELHNKNFEATVIGSDNIKLEYIVPKVTKKFKVLWQGLNGLAPDIKVVLLVNGSRTDKVITVKNGKKVVLFKDLDETNKSGEAYKYSIDVLGKVDGFNKTISANGKTAILTKDKPDAAYIPNAGAKENITVGLGLLFIIMYAKKMLKNTNRNKYLRTLNRKTFKN